MLKSSLPPDKPVILAAAKSSGPVRRSPSPGGGSAGNSPKRSNSSSRSGAAPDLSPPFNSKKTASVGASPKRKLSAKRKSPERAAKAGVNQPKNPDSEQDLLNQAAILERISASIAEMQCATASSAIDSIVTTEQTTTYQQQAYQQQAYQQASGATSVGASQEIQSQSSSSVMAPFPPDASASATTSFAAADVVDVVGVDPQAWRQPLEAIPEISSGSDELSPDRGSRVRDVQLSGEEIKRAGDAAMEDTVADVVEKVVVGEAAATPADAADGRPSEKDGDGAAAEDPLAAAYAVVESSSSHHRHERHDVEGEAGEAPAGHGDHGGDAVGAEDTTPDVDPLAGAYAVVESSPHRRAAPSGESGDSEQTILFSAEDRDDEPAENLVAGVTTTGWGEHQFGICSQGTL